MLDASRAVGVASRLLSDTQCEEFVSTTAADYAHVRDARAGKGQSELLSLEDARANFYDAYLSDKAAPPLQPGTHVFEDWDLAELRDYFDWTPFFRAWELHGTYPKILDDEVVGESARSLKADADAMLERIIAEKWLTARGVAGFWPCARDGDDVTIHDPDGETHTVLPFLRQQVKKSRSRPNMCLADFIDPAGDWMGGFAVGIHGIDPHSERFRADKDDYSDILLKALADRFAEAFAERLHQFVRTALWGYAEGEQLTPEALIKEQFRGIRPAPGYPACPDMAAHETMEEARWYRYVGSSGHHMLQQPPGDRSCSTDAPGWLSTPLPAPGAAPVPRAGFHSADAHPVPSGWRALRGGRR